MTVKPRRTQQRGRLPAAFPSSPVWSSSRSSGQGRAGAQEGCTSGVSGRVTTGNHTPCLMDILPRDGGSTEVLLHVRRVSPPLTHPDLDGNTSKTCSRHLDLPEGAPEIRWGLDTGSRVAAHVHHSDTATTSQVLEVCRLWVQSTCHTGLVTKITDGKSYRL